MTLTLHLTTSGYRHASAHRNVLDDGATALFFLRLWPINAIHEFFESM